MLKVLKVANIWRNIFAVTYRIGRRSHTELFRPINGEWFSGEAHPTGTKSSPLRKACPQIAAALSHEYH